MKKKIIIAASLALVVIVLVVVLVACSQAAKQDQQEPQNLGAQQTVPVTAEPEETQNPEPEQTTEPETSTEPTETPAPSEIPETIPTVPEPTPEPEPENDYVFADVDETVYVINTTIAYSNPLTSSGAVAQLSVGQSFTRTGIGIGAQAGWSRIQFEDGVAYVNGDDLSLIAPAEPSQESTPEPTPAPTQPGNNGGNGGGSGKTQQQPGGGSGKTPQEEDEELARRFAEDRRQTLIDAGLDPDNHTGEGDIILGGIWID